MEAVDHPTHYGGADNHYEAIRVIEAWELGFCLGNCVKYICRAGKKPRLIDTSTHEKVSFIEGPASQQSLLEDLRKAAWYLNREIERLSSTMDTSSS
jgi:hypothetical protein